MRNVPLLNLLAFALLAACVTLSGADSTPASPEPIKLPATLACGTVCDDHVIAITSSGALLDVDLKQRKVRDLGTPGGRLLPVLDVADGKVCVAAEGRIHIVSLTDGKAVRSMEFKGKAAGVGFAGEGRVFVHEGTAVTVLDAAGKQQHRIELGTPTKEMDRWARGIAFHRVGQRLYTGTWFDGNLRVVDLEDGKLLDTIKLSEWQIGGVRVKGNSAYVVGLRLGYGIWTNSFVQIDLKTKKVTVLDLPPKSMLYHEMRGGALGASPDGTMLLTGGHGTWRYSDSDKPLAKVAERGGMALLGVWNGQVLIADRESVQFTKLTAATVKAD